MQYVTKYATKAPKGSRRVREVLKDAVDEVCQYVPDGEGADFLRRAIQKFFARTIGERAYGAFEAVQLGLQLPLVIPLMPVVSLNTSGSRPMKTRAAICYHDREIEKALDALNKEVEQLNADVESEERTRKLEASRVEKERLLAAQRDAPMHWDSRVDKFNQRFQILRKQFAGKPVELEAWLREIRDVSLYEFWWKYSCYKGVLKRAVRSVAIMVTPSFSADCANVEHKSHENYARAAVVAYWRHMSTEERYRLIRRECETGRLAAIDDCFIGATRFEQPRPNALDPTADRFLGTTDLFIKFEGLRASRWGYALMEMLVDPLLSTWVPDWVIEQYERANPFFKDVLRSMRHHRELRNNAHLLRATRAEMVRRHQRRLRKEKAEKDGKEVRGQRSSVGRE